jgi:predicted dehydrogenase
MRLLVAAGASGDANLEKALIGAPSLDIVGHERPDAQAIVLAAADAGDAAAEAGIPCAVFTSAVAGTAGLSILQAERGSRVSVLAPALHRAPHSLLRASLDTGRIGSPRFLRWTRWTRWAPAGPDELPGALIDELVAVLDLMGRPAVTAYAAGQAIGTEGPDYLTAILTFERGLTAVLDVGAASSGGQPFDRAMLIGANGSIHADGRASAALRLGDSESTPLDLDGPFAGHIRAVEAFTRGESLDPAVAAQTAAVQEAVLASMESGRAEAIGAPGN